MFDDYLDWSLDSNLEKIPYTIKQRIKLGIADTIGVIIRGSFERVVKNAVKSTKDLFSSNNEATDLTTGHKTGILRAAYANSLAGHVLLFDDEYNPAILHPGCVIIPTLLAMGEKKKCSGEEFLLSSVLSYETAIRLAVTLSPFDYDAGFSPTGTVNSIGANVGLSHMMKYSLNKTKVSIAIAAQEMSGTRIYQLGGHTHYAMFLSAYASMNSLISVKSANIGLESYSTIGDKDSIFYKAFTGNHIIKDDYFNNYGNNWYISDLTFKQYPSSRFCHGPVLYILSLVKEKNITWEQIKKIDIGLDKNRYLISNIEDVNSVGQAIFSLQFNLSVAILFRQLTITEFNEKVIQDPRIKVMLKKIKIHQDEDCNNAYPERWITHIEVLTNTGEKISYTFDALKLKEPTIDQIREKFTNNLSLRYSNESSEEIFKTIMGLEKLEKINDLSDML